jgi:hypothetical protein
MLCMLDGVLTWTAHSEHQEVCRPSWAGPSWSSVALRYDVAFIWSIKPFISHIHIHICIYALADCKHLQTHVCMPAALAGFNMHAHNHDDHLASFD